MITQQRYNSAIKLKPIVNMIRELVERSGFDSPELYRHYINNTNSKDDNIKPIRIKHEPIRLYLHPKDIDIDTLAENEGRAIANAFKPKTMDFGKRKNSKLRLNNQISSMPKVINHRYIWKSLPLM
jgi:intein-encoded DNA endonuclease-like protein